MADDKGKGKGKSKAARPPPAPPLGRARIEELHAACQFDDEAAVARWLADRTSDLTARTSRGATLLHTAAVNGSVRVARLLLAEGAEANATNAWREAPLHLAAASGHAAAVEALVSMGANMEVLDNWGRTPLRVARESGAASAAVDILVNSGAREPGEASGLSLPGLNEGQQEQQRDVTEEFMARMKERPADAPVPEPQVRHMFAPTSGASAAVGAAAKPAAAAAGAVRRALSKLVEYPGDPAAVARQLEDPSVDPSGRDMFGLTALHKFAAWDKADLLELLLPHLSEEDLNATGGDDGHSALHHAVSMGAVHTLARLLEDARVSRSVVDKAGRTPSELAASMPGFEALAAALK